MIRTALSEPGPGGTCRVCDQKLPEGSLHCTHCGAVWGEGNRCPHCRAVAAIESTASGGRCRVCGGPRLGVDDARTLRSGREVPVLLHAQRSRRAAAALGTGAALAGVLAVLTLAAWTVAALAGSIGAASTVIGVGVVAAIATLGVVLLRRAGVERRAASRALSEARLLVASDVVRSHAGEMDASRMAKALHITETEAELLLAELSLNDYLNAHVTEDGKVRLALSNPSMTELAAGSDAARDDVEGHLPAATPRARGSAAR